MESGHEFSLFEQTTPVNYNLELVFEPDSRVSSYNYKIYKDGAVYFEKEVDAAEASFISLTETGIYEIEVDQVIEEDTILVKSGLYLIDKEAPVIEIDNLFVTMKQGAILDIMGGVKAYDNYNGDLTNKVSSNASTLDFTTIGLKKLIYTVEDAAGNTTSKAVTINVVKGTTSELVATQSVIIFFLFLICIVILFYQKSIKKEKRVAKFAIEPIYDRTISLADKFLNFYYKIIVKVKHILENFPLIKKHALKFDKYVRIANNIYDEGLDFIASKIVIAFFFIFIAIFFKTTKYEVLKFYEISLPLLAGYFIPNIVYFYKYKVYYRRLSNDLLQAVMIMNNAFKSGRSITQAIYLVTTELEGPIAYQFKKLYTEISLGLSLEEAFKRLEKRVNLEGINYLTASIVILNKTGGNIIKVFTSIEKTLFNKKKLKLELKSLTGSSRVISYILFCIPILFAVFMMILDPTYFLPFFTNTFGLILFGIMIIIYILYVVFVIKIMRVKL